MTDTIKTLQAIAAAHVDCDMYSREYIITTFINPARAALAQCCSQEEPPKQWVDAGNLRQLKKGDRIRIFYDGVEDVEFTLGGSANNGANGGTFCWYLNSVSGGLCRYVGARVGKTGAVYADRGYKVEVLK